MGGILEYLITYPNALKNDAQHNLQVCFLRDANKWPGNLICQSHRLEKNIEIKTK